MKLKYLLIAFLILVLIAVGYYFFWLAKSPKTPANEAALTGAQEMMGEQGFRTAAAQTSEMWWGEEGERFILNEHALSFVTNISLTDAELGQYVTSETIRVFEHPDLTKIYELLDNYFIEDNFSPNSYNSLPLKVGLAWNDYVVAYERDDLKCSITTHNEVATYNSEEDGSKSNEIEIVTACTDDWTTAENEQNKYITDLGLTGDNVGVSLVARVGKILDLILLQRNSPDAYHIIAEENGTLNTLFNSRTDGPSPLCSKMQGVPTSFYLSCH